MDKSLIFSIKPTTLEFIVEVVDREKKKDGGTYIYTCMATAMGKGDDIAWKIFNCKTDEKDTDNKEALDYCVASACLYLLDMGVKTLDLQDATYGLITNTLIEFGSGKETDPKVFYFRRSPTSEIAAHISYALGQQDKPDEKIKNFVDGSGMAIGLKPKVWQYTNAAASATYSYEEAARALRDLTIDLGAAQLHDDGDADDPGEPHD